MQPRQLAVKNNLVYWIRFFVFITVLIGAIEASGNEHQTQADNNENSQLDTPELPSSETEEEQSNSEGVIWFQSIAVPSCPPGACDDCTCDSNCECMTN